MLIQESDWGSSLHLDISRGPRKVLDYLQEIDRDETYHLVHLYRNFPSPLRGFTSDTLMLQVFESVAALPNASNLKISYASATFPIHLLMQVLAGTPNQVETLDLLSVKFSYRDAMAVTKMMQQQQQQQQQDSSTMSSSNINLLSLKTISLENCKAESTTGIKKKKGEPLDLFLASLASMKSLESLKLHLIEKEFLHNDLPPFPWLQKLHLERLHVSEPSLNHILRCSPQLEELSLQSLVDPPQNAVLLSLARALSFPTEEHNNHNSSCRLRILKLRFIFHNLHHLDEQAHNAFWEMLQHNHTLQEIHLTMNWRMDPYDSIIGIPIAAALRHHTLQRLYLHTRIDDNPQARDNLKKSLILMAHALRDNETLRQFDFCLAGGLRGYDQDQVYNLLRGPFQNTDILEEQYSLERLGLWYRAIGYLELTDKMNFFLKLNQAGRGRLLLGNPTRRDWVDAVVANHSDVSVVFFLLSHNPLLSETMLLGL
ncbi:expressed unknown protein [Seminavis robusta]|uniref:F-box/LRR-repeat protein 15/At3g58940/PEG3-like LRR domain-containing protein n=1 Tax=Seminavis robusta TaxID=568900 RepID=A0A9N8HRZ8_9STRA|nr:expressed unknown protein [Seminavis robusta]|eukprot:Sro1122_g243480.1 n/a (485) ;mRNA; r:8013-9467